MSIDREATVEAIMALEERLRRSRRRKLLTYYPDRGPLRRELYPKHNQFFESGLKTRQRLMLAANRVGKTEGVGLYELTLHLTGWYPEWWKGRRFNRPIKAWAAGDTAKTVRTILQQKLLGPSLEPDSLGTGLIPGEVIKRFTRSSVGDGVDVIHVKSRFGAGPHDSGQRGISTLQLMSYEQGRIAFQGAEVDVILLDEEPPLDIYIECLMRTMTNHGLIMLTFTPLMGMSDVVLSFLPGGSIDSIPDDPDKAVIMASWDDVPHLDEDAKAELLRNIPPFQRDARSRGIPQLGAGAIYPVPESDIKIKPFKIPEEWPRVYGMDVGWNRTAVVWGAIDPSSKILYIYDEHYRGAAEPIIHAQAIKARGEWIPGVIDPAARGRGQKDGSQLLDDYRDLGLELTTAQNAVTAGTLDVWQRLSLGQMKVFESCSNWFAEFRLYRRDEKGNIVKQNDHLMDASRYLVVSGLEKALSPPPKVQPESGHRHHGEGSWMG